MLCLECAKSWPADVEALPRMCANAARAGDWSADRGGCELGAGSPATTRVNRIVAPGEPLFLDVLCHPQNTERITARSAHSAALGSAAQRLEHLHPHVHVAPGVARVQSQSNFTMVCARALPRTQRPQCALLPHELRHAAHAARAAVALARLVRAHASVRDRRAHDCLQRAEQCQKLHASPLAAWPTHAAKWQAGHSSSQDEGRHTAPAHGA
jgi:hypothetical protein